MCAVPFISYLKSLSSALKREPLNSLKSCLGCFIPFFAEFSDFSSIQFRKKIIDYDKSRP
jgi:hypothetical protein